MNTIKLTDQEKRQALSMIKNATTDTCPSNVAHLVVFQETQNEKNISFDDWNKQIHTWPHKNNGGRKSNVQSELPHMPKIGKVNFSELETKIIEECGCLPNDKIMQTIASYLGYKDNIASVTRTNIVKSNRWEVTIQPGDYWIFKSSAIKQAQDALNKAKNDYDRAMKEYLAAVIKPAS